MTPLRTGRGAYRLAIAAPPKVEDGATMLTLALERADGIERVVFACHIAESLLASNIGADQILGALATWIEHDFEPIREAALKTIRTERKLHEIVFDQEHPGPFRTS